MGSLRSKTVSSACVDQLSVVVGALSHYRTKVLNDNTVDLAVRCNAFPVQQILHHYHTYGKHFGSTEVLEELLLVQEDLRTYGPVQDHTAYDLLNLFLHMLLDKRSGQYDYLSYVGTQLPERVIIAANHTFAEYQEMQIAYLLGILSDIIFMEYQTLMGEEKLFNGLMPNPLILKRRIFNALKAIDVYRGFTTTLAVPIWLDDVLQRWKQEVTLELPLSPELGEMTANLIFSMLQQLSRHERLLLDMTILPVWTTHDEYMFIRILQSFEVLFGITIKGFLSCQNDIQHASFASAQAVMEILTDIYRRSPALFRVLTTMQRDSFSAFRVYTEGASAIQSERYKTIEVLAASVPQERLRSAAFLSVPPIKETYEQKQIENFEHLLQSFLSDPSYLASETFQAFLQSMKAFDQSFVAWKNMHCNIAVKMLGSTGGTGGTPGPSYLKKYVNDSIFPFIGETVLKTGV